jgi:hypothetical protein
MTVNKTDSEPPFPDWFRRWRAWIVVGAAAITGLATVLANIKTIQELTGFGQPTLTLNFSGSVGSLIPDQEGVILSFWLNKFGTSPIEKCNLNVWINGATPKFRVPPSSFSLPTGQAHITIKAFLQNFSYMVDSVGQAFVQCDKYSSQMVSFIVPARPTK